MKTALLTGLTMFGIALGAQAQRIGWNVTDGWPAPMLAGETADNCSTWFDSMANYGGGGPNPQLGSMTLSPTPVAVVWNSANTWAAGYENDSGQQLYRVYLDDGDGGSSLVNGDGIGVSVTISGLSAWMTANNLTGYQVRAYGSTDTGNASFQPVNIRLGAPNAADGANQLLNLSILDTITVARLGDGTFPTGTDNNDSGSRGYGDSSWLTADLITLTIPSRNGSARGTLAGFQLVVPEPSSVTLLVLGLGGLLTIRSRRR